MRECRKTGERENEKEESGSLHFKPRWDSEKKEQSSLSRSEKQGRRLGISQTFCIFCSFKRGDKIVPIDSPGICSHLFFLRICYVEEALNGCLMGKARDIGSRKRKKSLAVRSLRPLCSIPRFSWHSHCCNQDGFMPA